MPCIRLAKLHALFSLLLGSALGAQVQFAELRPLPAERMPTYNVVTGDVDGDGDVDVVLVNVRAQSQLYLNDGFGNFTDVTAARLPQARLAATDAALVDVDADKDLDLVLVQMVSAGLGSQTLLYKNDGKGKFSDATIGNMPVDKDNTFDICVGDVDFDSDIDLLLANYGGETKLYVNDGRGKFTDFTKRVLPSKPGPTYYVALADLDGDGDLDILEANRDVRNRVLIYDIGQRKFVDETSTRLPLDKNASLGVSVVDIDGDRDLDVVFANDREPNTLFLNDGKAKFSDVSSRLPTARNTSHRIVPADVDGDGDFDLIVANSGQQNRLLINDGNGNFSDQTAKRLPVDSAGSAGLAVTDFDCDGDPDILFGNWGTQGKLLLNLHRQVHATDPLIGQNYTLEFYLMPGYAKVTQVSTPFLSARALTPKVKIAPWGYLGIVPSVMVVLPPRAILAPGGRVSLVIPVPNLVGLRGVRLYTQALAHHGPLGTSFTNTNVNTLR